MDPEKAEEDFNKLSDEYQHELIAKDLLATGIDIQDADNMMEGDHFN